MRRIKVLITLDALHKQPGEFPVWELQVLRHVHGDASVVEIGETRCNLRVPPPAEELARLERRYGINKDTRVPRAIEIFGAGEVGVRRLSEAMHDDLLEQERLDAEAAAAAQANVEATPDPVAETVVEERKKANRRAS